MEQPPTRLSPPLSPPLLLLLLSLLLLLLTCRLARHPRPLEHVLLQQKGSLHIFGPALLRTPLEIVAVRRGLLPPATCEAALRDLRGDTIDWQAHRHEEHPTVDAELCDALPWLDDMLAVRLPGLLGDMGHVYGVDPSTLWLREAFCVKYDGSITTGRRQRLRLGQQAGLETHRDASVFSFVIPLTDATRDHCGGGTTFDGRRGPRLAPGGCLLFCGRNPKPKPNPDPNPSPNPNPNPEPDPDPDHNPNPNPNQVTASFSAAGGCTERSRCGAASARSWPIT